MRVFAESVGLLGPGLTGWSASRPILRGALPYAHAEVTLPAPEKLPAAERRRTGLPVRLAIAVGLDALSGSARTAESLAAVFTSSEGDGQVIDEICRTLNSPERMVSPTRFHNSVHNAPAGYWSIALHAAEPSTSLCGFDWSFAAGLLEACAQCLSDERAVLLISYDLPYPEPLHSKRIIVSTLGAALLLSPERGPAAFAQLDIEVEAGGARTMSSVQQPDLDALQWGNPTGRALPLLRALAGPETATVVLEYLSGSVLSIEVAPC